MENNPNQSAGRPDYYLNRSHKGWDLFAGILIGLFGTIILTPLLPVLNVLAMLVIAIILIKGRRRRFIGIGMLTGLAILLLVIVGCAVSISSVMR